MKIAIDIGHARATGATGNGLDEHEVCTALSRLLADYLGNNNTVQVFDFPGLTNKGDLVATAKAINEWGADVSVSLHCDSSHNATARGGHVIYVSEAGREVAVEIAARLCAIMPGRADKTVRKSGLYVLNNTLCPAVLVECGFLTNSKDADMLRYEAHRIARAIGLGVAEWKRKQEIKEMQHEHGRVPQH